MYKLLIILLLHLSAFADNEKKNEQDYNKVIESFKSYLATVSQETRDEVREYRENIIILNQKKKDSYNKLSQETQKYLKELQKFKSKLPLKQKNLIYKAEDEDSAKDNKGNDGIENKKDTPQATKENKNTEVVGDAKDTTKPNNQSSQKPEQSK